MSRTPSLAIHLLLLALPALGCRDPDAVDPHGDNDGDDLDDFFVGAPYNDDGGTDAGKLYLIIE